MLPVAIQAASTQTAIHFSSASFSTINFRFWYDFEGGQTMFPDPWSETFVVEPICGDAIIFDHDVLHAGAEVFAGSKYILRGDFLAR